MDSVSVFRGGIYGWDTIVLHSVLDYVYQLISKSQLFSYLIIYRNVRCRKVRFLSKSFSLIILNKLSTDMALKSFKLIFYIFAKNIS